MPPLGVDLQSGSNAKTRSVGREREGEGRGGSEPCYSIDQHLTQGPTEVVVIVLHPGSPLLPWYGCWGSSGYLRRQRDVLVPLPSKRRLRSPVSLKTPPQTHLPITFSRPALAALAACKKPSFGGSSVLAS